MLINLLPDFFAVLNSSDRVAAYLRYYETNYRILSAYWHNYVLDPSSTHFTEVIQTTVLADRSDLRSLLERVDIVSLAHEVKRKCDLALQVDEDFDTVLMVGVGAANAGELVVNGKGIAFVCLEHFTGIPNAETQGLGLDPELLSVWLAHEIAHVIRYTSPTSRSELHQLITAENGYYSYWETARQVSLRELIANEGIAIHVAQTVSPGHAPWEYFGYSRRQYTRLRELEPILASVITDDLDRYGLGLRLRYLSGGISDEARTIGQHILPERSGYFIGTRMTENSANTHGLAWAVRATAQELTIPSYQTKPAVSA